MTRPTVVFLDRDGTIIHDTHYLSRPAQVRLLDGAAAAIAQLNRAHVPVILITNQSGIGRGYFTEEAYARVHAHLTDLLARQHAHLDASYHCPDTPEDASRVPSASSCRKPSLLLFQRAIAEHHLDSSRAVALGDRWRDVAPVIAMGGTGILIPSPSTPPDDVAHAERDGAASLAPSLAAAVQRLLASA